MIKPNILIVEDEKKVAGEIKETLESYNYNVTAIVTTGEAAIKKVKKNKIDLVLMDIVLASPMKGTEAADKIWSEFKIPIIFLTGYFNVHLLEEAKISKPLGYLLKPFNDRELYAAIEIALYKREIEEKRRHFCSLLNIEKNINHVINRTNNSKKLIERVTRVFTSAPEFSGASLILFNKMHNINESVNEGIDDETQQKIIEMFSKEINHKYPRKLSNKKNNNITNIHHEGITVQSVKLNGRKFIIIKLINRTCECGILSLLCENYELQADDMQLLKSIANDIIISQKNISLNIKKKEIFRALVESEKRYHEVIEDATDIIFITDLCGNFTYVNKAWITNSGFTEKEILGLNYLEFILPNHKDTVKKFYEEQYMSKQNSAYLEYPFKTKDGRIKWFGQVSNLIFNNNNVSGFHLIARDITDRKKMEEVLKHRQNEMTTLLDSIPGFAFLKDNNHKYIIANQLFCDLMGYTKKEIIGKTDYDLLPAKEAEVSINEDIKIIKTGCTICEDKKYLSLEGKSISIDSRKIPLKDEDGNVTSIIGLGFDITVRKAAEEAIKKNSESLEDINLTKDKFFSIISHDLKSPFQGLLGISSILVDEFETFSNEEIKSYIVNLNDSIKNLYNLIENLLNWSRLQRGSISLDKTKIDLYNEVLYVINLLKRNADNKEITIVNEIVEGTFVYSDANVLNSVLQNLISNSIKFTNRNGEIKLSSATKDKNIEVTIADNGIGMTKGLVKNLFKNDAHQSSPGTENESGTGFGLIITKELLEKQGGKITVKSQKSVGTSITFTLPIDGTV
ncbi:MAG TPA: PAS domain S-box protein [Ignavibacteria bacterium]|nr:PAS domain S-box protein [Ignavibacteria bacterium]